MAMRALIGRHPILLTNMPKKYIIRRIPALPLASNIPKRMAFLCLNCSLRSGGAREWKVLTPIPATVSTTSIEAKDFRKTKEM
jgi:hypothetical protein